MPWDLQAVGFINELLSEATDTTVIPAYLAGGMAFRALRLGAVGNWVAAPGVKNLSSFFSRQFGASTLALGGEVAAFTGAHRLAASLAENPAVNISPTVGLGMEMAQTGITLASLRSFGFGFGILGGALQRAGLAGVMTPGVLSTLGAYTGLLTAQKVEQRLLHPEISPTGNPFYHAGISLLHFTIGNTIAAHITPPAWRSLEMSLEQKTHRLLSEKAAQIRNSFPTSLDGGLALATVEDREDLKTQGIFKILEDQGSELIDLRSASQSSSSDRLDEFWAGLPNHQRKLIRGIFKMIQTGNENLSKTLAESQWVGDPRFDLALRRLHHVLEHTPVDGSQSWYINWITRLGFERILENSDVESLDKMIEMITTGTSRVNYENFLSQHLPEGTYTIKAIPKVLLEASPFKNRNHPQVLAIENLPLGPKAKEMLQIWYLNQTKDTGHTPFFIPQDQFLIRLEDLAKWKDKTKWGFAEEIIEGAGNHPLGRLQLYRLYQILHTQMDWDGDTETYAPRGWLGTKLRELRDKSFRMAEELPGNTFLSDQFAFGAKGGYLGYNGPDRLLRPMLHQFRELLDPEVQQARLKKRQEVLKKFLADHPKTEAHSIENLAKAFALLSEAFKGENWEFDRKGKMGDFSFHAAQDLTPENFHLEVHTPNSYEIRYREILNAYETHKGRAPTASQVLPTKGKIIHYKEGFEIPGIGEKSLILIVLPEEKGTLTPEDLYFDKIMKTALHELAHDWQIEEYDPPTQIMSAKIKQEAATHTTHNWFQIQGGEVEEAYLLASEGLGGYMMRYLDTIEDYYKKHWEKKRHSSIPSSPGDIE